MTDAQHRTPREQGIGTPLEQGIGTPREQAPGTPREQGIGSGVPAPAPAHAAPPSPAAGAPGSGSHAVGSHAPGPHVAGSESGPVLLAPDERDKFGLRLQQALSTFVESPRQAVEEADGLFDDAVRHLTETLTERRHILRAGWQGHDTEAHTEELRLALRQYREATERLLSI